ncbi:MAG: hypothetical protein ACRCY8_07100 [Dermatophilaceae bacterium]
MGSERGDAAAGLARAVALAWFAVGSAGLAHGTAGGHAPDAVPVAMLVAVVGIGAAPLFARRLARSRAVLVVVATQLLTHLVLTASAGPASTTSGSTVPAGAAHHGAVPRAAGQVGTASLLDLTPRMAAAHLLAAALVVAVLRGVEESWGRRTAVLGELASVVPTLLRLARRTVVTPVALVVDGALARIRAGAEWHRVPVAPDVWRSPVHVRRGPPLVAAS